MPPSDTEIQFLLAEQDEALRRWYGRYLAADEDPELVLSAGAFPPPEHIRRIFDQWLLNCQGQLRAILCERLGYARLTDRSKQVGEVALVSLVAGLLAGSAADLVIDPLSTAAVLVARRELDNLCVLKATQETSTGATLGSGTTE